MSVRDYYDALNSQTGLKAYLKKRLFGNLLNVLVEQENQLKTQENQLKTQENQLKTQELFLQKQEQNIGAIARQLMLTKWKMIDSLIKVTEHPDDVLTCDICGYSQKRSEYETKITDCIFNGGKLVRYVCPGCGVIFGPTKFLAQGQKGIDEDYWVHYLGFSEGDSTYKEERAFFMLKPEKEKIYLNYGCGRWTKSLQKLRNKGFNVYGYEPYAPEIDNPYLITNKERLKEMRFDGIYSNDVLEHFIHPIGDLKFMATLLQENGKMSHCTSCYVYKYEYTRFHTHFFTGDSVYILADKAGLKIDEFCDDLAKNDFICYVFSKNR